MAGHSVQHFKAIRLQGSARVQYRHVVSAFDKGVGGGGPGGTGSDHQPINELGQWRLVQRVVGKGFWKP